MHITGLIDHRHRLYANTTEMTVCRGLVLYLQVVEEQVCVGQFKDQLLHLKAQVQHSGWVLPAHAHTHTHTHTHTSILTLEAGMGSNPNGATYEG